MNAMKLYLLVALLVVVGGGSGFYLLNQSNGRDGSPSLPGANAKTALVWFGFVDLRHGPTGLYPVQPGRVVKVLVGENQDVSKGMPLLALDDTQALLRLKEAEAALATARKELARAEKLPEQHRLKLAQQKSAIEALDARVSAAELLFTVKKNLQKNSLINAEELAAAEKQIKEIKALRDVERTKLAELKLANPDLDVEIARQAVVRLETQLALAQNGLDECRVTAPDDGTILRVLVNPGEILGLPAQQPAILFAPKTPWIVRAEVEQEFAGKIQIGQEVQVEDDTNVELLAKGKVSEVSNWFLPRRFRSEDPTRLNTGRTLECIITLEPGHRLLRLGQRVRIRIGT
jgi:HlyD family secretion protein